MRQKDAMLVILAGGRGRRMGERQKLLCRVGQRPILCWIYERLGAQFEHVAINLSPHLGSVATPAGGPPAPVADREKPRTSPPRRRERFFGLPCLYDEAFLGQGPLAGLLTALTYARRRGLSYVMTVPSDTPFLPVDLYLRLREALATATEPHDSVCVATPHRHHPTLALWRVELYVELQKALARGTRKIDDFTAGHAHGRLLWPVSSVPASAGPAEDQSVVFDPFFNLNTPRDWAYAEQLSCLEEVRPRFPAVATTTETRAAAGSPCPPEEPSADSSADESADPLADLARFRQEHPHPPVWIFAYGSLIWKPAFQATEARLARLAGYRRCLGLWSVHWRGTPTHPGLVFGLEEKTRAHCWGMALRMPPPAESSSDSPGSSGSSRSCEDRDALFEDLWSREMIQSAYRPALVPLELDDGRRVQGLAFVLKPGHPQMAGPLPFETQAQIVATATGTGGTNRAYFFESLACFERAQIPTGPFQRLARRVRQLTEFRESQEFRDKA